MNTMSVERPTRPDSIGLLLKTLAVGPDVIVSTLLGVVIIAALPPAVGVGVAAATVAVAAILAAGLGESTAVRILHGARRPTATEALRLDIPWRNVTSRVDTTGVHLRIVTHAPAVGTAGRHHVLLARDIVDAYRAGQLTDGEVAALIAHGIGRLHHGHTRLDLLWTFWTAPWAFIRGLFDGAGRHLAWVPLGRFAWQTRFIVGTIAVVLDTYAGRWPSPIIIAGFIVLSYLMPHWRGSWERQLTDAADRDVTQAGFGDGLVRFLGRLACSPELAGRIDRLTGTVSSTAQ